MSRGFVAVQATRPKAAPSDVTMGEPDMPPAVDRSGSTRPQPVRVAANCFHWPSRLNSHTAPRFGISPIRKVPMLPTSSFLIGQYLTVWWSKHCNAADGIGKQTFGPDHGLALPKRAKQLGICSLMCVGSGYAGREVVFTVSNQAMCSCEHIALPVFFDDEATPAIANFQDSCRCML